MRAGSFNHYIEIHQPEAMRDAAGDTETTYTLLSGAWARLIVNRGRTIVEADKPSEVTDVELEIRAIPAINRHCRVLFFGEMYLIDALLPAKNGQYRLHCKRID
jgi:head-tail adaptor